LIYLDNNASTKLDPQVREAIERALEVFGNPSSIHAEGRRARRLVEESREEVARLVGADASEIFFTSGGTEANAMAVFGGAAAGQPGGRIVCSGAEHPSVREAVEAVEAMEAMDAMPGGASRVVRVNPDPSGALDAARVLEAAGARASLVTVMAANNEYGGLFPVGEIGAALRERGILFHTDAVQAAGRIAIDARAWQADLATISAHKIHGPKGVGALYIRKGVRIAAHTPGGGQEKKLRAGTENTAGIAGFGVAARLARERLAEAASIARLRDELESGILKGTQEARAVGAGAPRLPNTSAILFPGIPAEALLVRLDLEGIAASAGSACSSGTLAPSPAILSLGLPRADAKSVIRFSLSRFTTREEIASAVGTIVRVVTGARVQSR
jgi:cysteine desulfurase